MTSIPLCNWEFITAGGSYVDETPEGVTAEQSHRTVSCVILEWDLWTPLNVTLR